MIAGWRFWSELSDHERKHAHDVWQDAPAGGAVSRYTTKVVMYSAHPERWYVGTSPACGCVFFDEAVPELVQL